ncbi:MAG: hypothetical protein ABSC25_07520 [Roseiarcus sp.]
MSDNNNDDADGLADPFYYEDSISQRAMAFYYVAKISDTVKDKAVRELCLTMLRKLNSSIKAPSTAELHAIDGGAQSTTPHNR